MTTTVKFILILLTIICFCSGIVNLFAIFVSHYPQNNAMFCLASFILSKAINQEIIDAEELNEPDETFY